MSAASHKYKRFCLTECRRSGYGLPVLLQGGPLDGLEETIPLLSAGVMCCRSWPDGDDGQYDYFYPRTPYRTASGRVICRFSGRGVRA
jgi:hypothetical protein